MSARTYLLQRRALRRLGWRWNEGDQSWFYDTKRFHALERFLEAYDPFSVDYYQDYLQVQMLEWLLARKISLSILPQEGGSVLLDLNSHVRYHESTLLDALTAAVGGASTYVSFSEEACPKKSA